MQKHQLIFACVIFILSLNAKSQNTGNLYLFVNPENSIIRIDSELFSPKKDIIYMKPGTYSIKMWAPKRKLVSDTLIVKENSVNFFRKNLPFTEEYKIYRAQNFKYKTIKNIIRFIGIPLTSYFALKSYNEYKIHNNDANDYLDKVNEIKGNFPGLLTIDQINLARQEFDKYSLMYDKAIDDANKKMKETQLILGSGIIITTALNYCTRFLYKPSYSETPLLSVISIEINEHNNLSLRTHLNISSK